MKEEFKTVSQKALPTLLKNSEKHAMEWCIERATYRSYFERQIEKGYLSMSVSAKTIKRSMRILEQLLLKLYEAGFTITVERNRYHLPASAIQYDGEIVSFRIREKQVCKETKDRYHSRILVPTGKLELELYAGYFELKPSKLYADTEYTKLEDKIDNVVPYLKEAIAALKQIHQEEERRRKEREEQARQEKERQRVKEERVKLVKSILEDVRLYEKARTIRDYCDKMEPLVKSETYLLKIELARHYADLIDPTLNYKDELSESNLKTDL